MRIEGQPNRLTEGGVIDRGQRLTFQFDGRRYSGFSGDTVAAALLASGIRLVGRSFKYHRPRGIFGAGSEEPNALVELRSGARREANTRATVTELFDGLEARSQNRWPSLRFDIAAINSLFSPVFVAGFYYKTFMWPAAAWEKLYEPAIRRAAGLGRASVAADPDEYEKVHAFCDVLVIGGGPVGLTAALAAARSGARVILCDEDFLLGGRLNGDRHEIDGITGRDWARQVEKELEGFPDVRVLRRTTVFGVYDAGPCGARVYGAVERVADHLPEPPMHQPRQRYWKIVARRAVLAAGAIEQPLVFGGNDRPGVMLASAVRTYVNRYGVTAGRRVALFTVSDDGWKSAFDLFDAGIQVEAIIDARTVLSPVLLKDARRKGLWVLRGATVTHAAGVRSLRSIVVRDADGRRIRLSVDTLAVSGGWNPSIALSTHLGARPCWSASVNAFIPGNAPGGMVVVGAARGSFSLTEALGEGMAAGVEAAEATGFSSRNQRVPRANDELTGVTPHWHLADSTSRAFVDYQHDVTRDDIALAAREGFSSVELLKRYTTLGMATDQGKTSSLNGHAILAGIAGRDIAQAGTTVFRPPYTPVALGVFAGAHRGREFQPTRFTSGHAWATEQGATFVDSGQWLRAQLFARKGEASWLDTVSREVTAVRGSVGVCDVSTLGKIDVQGTDAGAFLDRVYVNHFSSLKIGKTRYGLMLREDGLAFDDGTCARFAFDHYVMSTTTANAVRVMQHLEHARQLLWPELDVQLMSVTEQWAQYAIAGPSSRALLQRLLGEALDVSNGAFPYMACAELQWRGVSARLFRISFSGELAYELAVPARFGDALIRAIMQQGEAFGITPYGTEALGVMRIEKGHVAGNELNGTTTAGDLGLARMLSTSKDFIGRMLATRPGLNGPGRPVLVGVKPVHEGDRIHAGAHFLPLAARATLESDQGYLTSTAYSPMLGHWVGLGFLVHGTRRLGERVRAYDPLRGQDVQVEIAPPVFFDPLGTRLQMGSGNG